MKTIHCLVTLGLTIALAGPAVSGDAIDDLNMGLSKTSVFDTPTPAPFAYSDVEPGDSKRLSRAWEGLPPQVPHRIEMYLPINTEDNQCLDCHDKPKYIGKDRADKSPMSRDHYASDDLEELAGARFTCIQCHVPQSNASPLVESTFR